MCIVVVSILWIGGGFLTWPDKIRMVYGPTNSFLLHCVHEFKTFLMKTKWPPNRMFLEFLIHNNCDWIVCQKWCHWSPVSVFMVCVPHPNCHLLPKSSVLKDWQKTSLNFAKFEFTNTPKVIQRIFCFINHLPRSIYTASQNICQALFTWKHVCSLVPRPFHLHLQLGTHRSYVPYLCTCTISASHGRHRALHNCSEMAVLYMQAHSFRWTTWAVTLGSFSLWSQERLC